MSKSIQLITYNRLLDFYIICNNTRIINVEYCLGANENIGIINSTDSNLHLNIENIEQSCKLIISIIKRCCLFTFLRFHLI